MNLWSALFRRYIEVERNEGFASGCSLTTIIIVLILAIVSLTSWNLILYISNIFQMIIGQTPIIMMEPMSGIELILAFIVALFVIPLNPTIFLISRRFATTSHYRVGARVDKTLENIDKVDRERYYLSLLSVENYNGESVGTGFLIPFQDRIYAITCSHVILKLKGVKQIRLVPFNTDINTLIGEVIWYKVQEDKKVLDWSAREDIAILDILDVEIELPTDITRLLTPLDDLNNSEGKTNSFFFGYVQGKGKRGDWFTDISCETQVAQGFYNLAYSGSKDIRDGISGAPLCHIQNGYVKICGMIQAKYGKDSLYLIPSSYIIEVLGLLVRE